MKRPTTKSLTMKKSVYKSHLSKMSDREKLQSKNLTAETQAAKNCMKKNERLMFYFLRRNHQQRGTGQKNYDNKQSDDRNLLQKKVSGKTPHSRNIKAEKSYGNGSVIKKSADKNDT